MKQYLLLSVLLCLSQAIQAQSYPWDRNVFNHLSVGVTGGTTGFGADVAVPVCKYLQVSAGFVATPDFRLNATLDVNRTQFVDNRGTMHQLAQDKIEVNGRPSLTGGVVMLDIQPMLTSAFHLTVGAYFCGPDIVDIHNSEDGSMMEITRANRKIENWNRLYPERPQQLIGLELGDYLLTPNSKGNMCVILSSKRIRPYVGAGFGRAVPRRRLGLRVDVGCMFWGKTKMTCNGERIYPENIGGNEGKFLRRLTKMQVYPCLNFRLCGRIF